MARQSQIKDPSATRRRGRPRLLTLDQVVQAGLEVGLDDLTIGAVALKLGVNVATIYTYVTNLDELRRLVATILARSAPMEDIGQPWPQVIRTAADSAFELLSNEPQLLVQFIRGQIGPEGTIRDLDAFLGLMERRGFELEEAYTIYRTIAWITGGAAISASMIKIWSKNGATRGERLEQAFARAEPDDLVNVRRLKKSITNDADFVDFHFAIESMIAQIAARRGETFSERSDTTNKGEMS